MDNEIEKIVAATIQTKVVEALNNTPEAIDKLVQAAMSKEVDQHGSKPSFRSSENMPYLEWLVGEEIRNAAREVIREYVAKNNEHIKLKVKKALASDALTNGITSFFDKAMQDEWRWNFEIKAEREK